MHSPASQKSKGTIGIDFGTTNSSIACADRSEEVQLAKFPYLGNLTDAYRSLLYLEQAKEGGRNTLKSWTGPEGIERYLSVDTKGRLIQSLKSFLSSRTLHGTEVFGRRYTLEDLIARILRDLRTKAEHQFGIKIKAAVVGRPVHFVGAEKPDDDIYAEGRLRLAFESAGYESVEFEMEPIAAAHYYGSTLEHNELILIGDFGGGTSDFSLVHVGPTVRREMVSGSIVGNAGVGIAGDAFDAKIIKHLVSPALGAGSELRSLGKILPVPNWVYIKLERWHHLSLLKARDVLKTSGFSSTTPCKKLRVTCRMPLEPDSSFLMVLWIWRRKWTGHPSRSGFLRNLGISHDALILSSRPPAFCKRTSIWSF